MSPQGPQARFLPDGHRLHLHHGPIDLIIGADGPGREAALAGAAHRFGTVLEELVAELRLLRRPVSSGARATGRIARAMQAAVRPFAAETVTPMAAVAGAVADDILSEMVRSGGLHRAYVNNGGDVALHLSPGRSFVAAIDGIPGGKADIAAEGPARGIATSGWRGRSLSLGIADSVTVLADTAAAADAAATMIANRVDLPDHPAIARRPACALSEDSDLGDRLVTVGVGKLTANECAEALARGADYAAQCRSRGLIHAALIALGGTHRVIGDLAPVPLPSREDEHA